MPRRQTLQGFYWSARGERLHLSFGRLSTRFQVAAGPFQLTVSRRPYKREQQRLTLRGRHRCLYWRHLYIGWLTTSLKGRRRP